MREASMNDLIERHRPELVELCHRFRVKRLDLFGSAARETFHPESSDIDFLVTLEAPSPGEYADNYLNLANSLEQLFHCRVDLVTERSIRNPYFREAVEATRESVYDARSEKASA